MGVLYTNNASTTLAAGLNDSATSTTVASSSGFPTISGSNYFYATLELADGSAHEIVKVTAVSGTTWTIVRGQDNTSARAFSSSDKVELRINSALLTDVVNDALASTFTRQAFTGDGSDTTFTLSRTPNSENDLFVFIEGVFQPHSTYSLSGTTLTFSEAPANSREITVYHVSAAVSGDSLSLNTFSGNGSTTAFTMSVDPVHENNTMVFIEGVYQEKSTYATSGTTLTFDTAPANGTSIDVTTHTQSLINVPVDASVTLAKMAANSVDSDQYVDGSIDTAHIADSQITVAKMAANSVDSDQYVDGSIDTAHYADNSITGAELADNIVIAGTLGSTGKITADAGIDIDNFNIDGTTIALSSGDMLLDAAGNIQLDADDSGEVRFIDGGTTYATIKKDGNNAVIQSIVADGDLVFQGIDGSSFITPMYIDMSAGGNVLIGTTTSSANHPLVVYYSATSQHHVGGLSGGLTNNTYFNGSAWANRNTGVGGAIFQLGTDGDFSFRRATSGSSPTVTYSMYITGAGHAVTGGTTQVASSTVSAYSVGTSNGFGAKVANEAWFNFVGNNTSDVSTFYVKSNGDYHFAGSDVSDKDLKENITDVPDGSLALVKQLKPRTFNFKASEGFEDSSRTGFIAQEVASVMTTDHSVATGTDGQKDMGVNPMGLIAHLTKAIQELEARLTALEDA